MRGSIRRAALAGVFVFVLAMIGMTPRIVAAGVVAGATSQDWDFATGGINLNNPVPPDVADNPFGNPTMAPLASGLLGEAFGRTGVITLLDHPAVFTIPNADDVHQKIVKVEIHYRFTNPNQVLGTASLVGGGGEAFQQNIPVDGKLADGWHFQLITWTRGTCPPSEILTIPSFGTGNPLYLDEVKVNTTCEIPLPLPAAMGLVGLALSGIGMVKRRG